MVTEAGDVVIFTGQGALYLTWRKPASVGVQTPPAPTVPSQQRLPRLRPLGSMVGVGAGPRSASGEVGLEG